MYKTQVAQREKHIVIIIYFSCFKKSLSPPHIYLNTKYICKLSLAVIRFNEYFTCTTVQWKCAAFKFDCRLLVTHLLNTFEFSDYRLILMSPDST